MAGRPTSGEYDLETRVGPRGIEVDEMAETRKSSGRMPRPVEDVREVCIRGCEEGALVVGGSPDLIVARVKGAFKTPEGAVLKPPGIEEKVETVAALHRRRGWKVRVAPELRLKEATDAIKGYLDGRVDETAVVPWVKALEAAAYRPWWPTSVVMDVTGVLKKLHRKVGSKTFDGMMILKKSDWEALHVALESRERRIEKLLEEVAALRSRAT